MIESLPFMPVRSRCCRRLFPNFTGVVAAAGFTLLGACASTPVEPLPATLPAAMPTDVSGAAPAPEVPDLPPMGLETWQVHAMQGKASVEWRGRRWRLKPGVEIDENQPVQVGADGALRLRMGQRALIDLGPNTRLVILQQAREGQGESRVTLLQLQQGYLRLVASDDRGEMPIRVSFGRWAARTRAGEHFFESQGSRASVCSTNGAIELDGVAEWKPRSASAPCVMLQPQHAPIELSLSEGQWEVLRRNRRLEPTLASVAQQAAVTASLDQGAARPLPDEPAPAPVVVAPPADVPNTQADAAQVLLESVPPAAGPMPPTQVAMRPPVVDPAVALDAPGPEWIVNVATYEDALTAQQHVQQFQGQGFNAAVRQESIKNRTSYRVVIEGLPNESAARSVVADLGARYGVKSAWAMRKR
ncbi:MAG: hypothetical protein K0Q76_2924 [Panacagrimonas sp.]|nr:hypothetical protein [Panacagrimonas sp.]